MSFLLAYVDPGLVGVFFQSIYAMLFGGAAMWILRPWRWLRGLGKSKTESAAPAAGPGEPEDQGGGSPE